MSFQYREIIAKSTIAKGRKFTKASHKVKPTQVPTNILGCWIINHQYQARKKGKKIEIHGYYDINTWYSYNKNTKTDVATERVTYTEEVSLKYRSQDFIDHTELVVKVVQQPNCVECIISECKEKFLVTVERSFITELIGETKLVVATSDTAEDEQNWENIIDDEELEEIDPHIFKD